MEAKLRTSGIIKSQPFYRRYLFASAVLFTFLLFGMCNWIYSWYHPRGPVSPEELSAIIYDLFMEGAKKYQ